MRRATGGSPAARLAALAATLTLVAAGCVSVSVPTNSPGQTGAPPTSASRTPGGTTSNQTGQPTPIVFPTPVNTHEGATRPPATPGPTIDPALAEKIDSVIAQVPAIRELEALAEVPYEFITREQFRDDLIELQFEEVPEETLRAEERLLKRLGLLPDDTDLLQLLVDLYGGQVAAFYRPDTKHFYIIQRDQPFGPTDKVIVAHEYTHALQDQHFDLEATRIKDLSQGDALLGQLAAIEGDATLTMQLWMYEGLSAQELFQAFADSLAQLNDPTLAGMPPVLRRQLEFPYAEGFSFVNEMYKLGGFDAVNTTITEPPASTEQVLHPEKYMADEAPVAVVINDASSVLSDGGDAWSLPYQQTVGELIMQVWAAGGEPPPETIPGFPVEWPHADVATGWGGDRLNMYEGPNGGWIIDWQTAWDTEADATEFEARFLELQGTFDGPARVFGSGVERRLMIASDSQTLNLLP